jgi:transcriptional regulator of acetoin/glycerol metabolism
LQLPRLSARPTTVILRDVEALSVDEQRDVFAWLDQSRTTRVVSTAFAPVLPLVEAGEFDGALYYRLNTIYIDLSD